MGHVYIIAEAGVNHNGDIQTAVKLIESAVNAGVDAVKFQTFKAEDLCSKNAPKADYQIQNTQNNESQFEMLKRLEFCQKDYERLIDHCNENKIDFISSPFDLQSIELLVRLDLPVIKIPSGEITNLPYLEKIGGLGKKVIISTGMANLDEIHFAVTVLLKSGMKINDLSLLHCSTQYPASMKEINLLAIKTMTNEFQGIRIGYSDHSIGIEVAIAAVALGAKIIEKHFTLDRHMMGPDHKASIEPDELKGMVYAIRNIEDALGNGKKQASASELKVKEVVRKSIVAGKNIKKGEKFSQNNLKTKRPGIGISPIKWYDVIGKKAKKNYQPDDLIML